MAKVYYVRDECGVDGEYYSTLREAQEDFQWRVDHGEEPGGVHSLSFTPTRKGIAALLNSIRPQGD